MEPEPFDLGRRDFLSVLTYLLMALFGRWTVPAQLAPAAEALQRVVTERAIFKGGTFKLSLMFKGFEVSPEMLDTLMQDSDFKSAMTSMLPEGSK
jgi:hypothetical protein